MDYCESHCVCGQAGLQMARFPSYKIIYANHHTPLKSRVETFGGMRYNELWYRMKDTLLEDVGFIPECPPTSFSKRFFLDWIYFCFQATPIQMATQPMKSSVFRSGFSGSGNSDRGILFDFCEEATRVCGQQGVSAKYGRWWKQPLLLPALYYYNSSFKVDMKKIVVCCLSNHLLFDCGFF